MQPTYHHAVASEISPETLYRILRLRVQVFVVEQECAYEDPDGRDLEPGTLLLWAADGEEVVATVRVLVDSSAMRIGRVVTAVPARSAGIAAELMRQAIAYCEQVRPEVPIVLDAQAHLAHWYARFGFVVDGDEFLEDNIPHVPMRRG